MQASESTLGVLVLGPPVLRISDRDRPFPTGRPGRLLASLLVARGRVVTDDRLIDDVWGEELPADARAALHTTVGRARQALGPEARRLERSPVGYRLGLDGMDLDADRFTTCLTRARSLDGVARLAAYEEALALWRGAAWAGLTAEVARGESLRLDEAHLTAREERASVLLELGREREAVGELRELLAEHPLRDRPALLLLRALHRLGAAAEALAVFAAHRRALAEELGLDPSPEIIGAQRDVLERAPVPGREPRHPVPAPDRIAHQMPDRGPGQPSDQALATPLGPVADQVLVGREGDVEQVWVLTARHGCVTIVGPGGVGKTALARAVAARASDSWWVDLTSVSTEAGVRAITATAMGVEVFPGGDPEAALRHRLETASGLLVLDNCEHVLAAVGDLVAESGLARSGLRILATSRERLGLPIEQVYLLAPLRLPGAGVVDADVPSVALFLERARAVAPDLEVSPDLVGDVAELVRRLDGLPLAIELAASRVGVVSLATLRHRLDDRLDLLRSHHRRGPARHRTLVDTINWSYDLLDEDHRRALRWLSVFAGPFDLDAAEAVIGRHSAEHVLGLAERSLLVRPGPTRGGYRMLDTVRSFARSQLDDAEREAASLAHARWAAAVAADARAGLAGPDVARWVTRVEDLLPELARALAWGLETGQVAEAIRFVPDLYPWAYFRVRADVMQWGQRLVQSGHEAALTPDILAVASSYWWMAGDQDRSASCADRAIELAGGPTAREAYLALNAAGDTALAVGDIDKAHHLLTHAMQQAAERDDADGVLLTAAGLLLAHSYGERDLGEELALMRRHQSRATSPLVRAMAMYAEADAVSAAEPSRALSLFVEARDLARATGNLLVLGVSMASETALLGRVGALDADTVDRTADAVRFWIGSGNKNLFVTCLRNVVSLLDRLGEHGAAVEVVATTTAQAPDRPSYGVEAAYLDASMTRARQSLTPPEMDAAWRVGAARDLDAAGEAVVAVLATHRPDPSI